MKKLLLIALLLVTLVVTAVACTNNDKPAADTTVAETTGATDPGETTVGGEEETTVGGEEDETTAGSEEDETTAGSEETTEGDTTEEVTRDPNEPVIIFQGDALAGNDAQSCLEVAAPIVGVTEDGLDFDYATVEIQGADPRIEGYLGDFTSARFIAFKYRVYDPGQKVGVEFYLSTYQAYTSLPQFGVNTEIVADGEWNLAVIDLMPLIESDVYDGCYVMGLRWDPIQAFPGSTVTATSIDYAWIAFFDTAEGAQNYFNGGVSDDEGETTVGGEEGETTVGGDEGETTVGGETPVGEPPVFVSDAQDMVFDGGANRCQGIVSAIVSEDGTYNIITVNNGDPYAWNFRPGQAVGGRYIGFKYRVTTEKAVNVEFFISGDGNITGDHQLRYALTADGEWHVGIIDTKPLIDAGLYDGENLGTFRFDPLAPATGSTLEDIGTDVIDYAWVGMFNAEADIEAYAAAN